MLSAVHTSIKKETRKQHFDGNAIMEPNELVAYNEVMVGVTPSDQLELIHKLQNKFEKQ